MPRDGTIEVVGTLTGDLSPTQTVTGNLSLPTERIVSGGKWGKITGNIEDQTDLQTELAKRENVIETVKHNGVELPIEAKSVNIRATDAEAATVQEVEAILYLD